jgi:hypothetical protein
LVPVLLKVVVLLNWSGLLFPNTIFPDPASVILVTPLKILLPLLASLVVPFFVAVTVPLNVHPLNSNVGLTTVRLPPKADVGPKVRLLVPVRVRLCAVLPCCVNCRRYRVPMEKPPDPTEIVSPEASVAVAVLLPLQNTTPCPLVEETTMLPLKTVPAEFWLTYIPVFAVGALLKVVTPLKTLLALL